MECYNLPAVEAIDYQYSEDILSPYKAIKKRLFNGMVPRAMLFLMQGRRYDEDTLTGDFKYDMELSTRLVPARLTIEHMLNVYNNGERVVIPREEDRVTIYKILSTHLKCCLMHNGDLYRGNPVSVLTLTIMDDFLDDLYPTAKRSIADDARPTIGAIARFNRAIGVMDNTKERNVKSERKRIISDDAIEEMMDEELGDSDFDSAFGGEVWE